MAVFEYQAKDQAGKIRNGKLEAESENAVRTGLAKNNLHVLFVKKKKKSLNEINIPFLSSGKVKTRYLVVFTRQLSTMVNAGVPLSRSIATLQTQSESPVLREHLVQINKDLEGGENFADALAKHPKIFSTIYVNMVRAGETGGILDDILKKLSVQLEKDAAIKGKIKSAMTYPSVIGTITIVAFFFLMTTIVPKIGDIIISLGGSSDALPIYTRVLLSMSNVMKTPVFLISMAIIIPTLLFAFRKYTATPAGKLVWHGLLLKMPIVKTLNTKVAVARFARTFASLNSAGVSVIQALQVTAAAIGNAVIEKDLIEISKQVQAGSQLSAELEKSKYFPSLVAQMMAVGEETGQTGDVLVKVAEFYEEEVDVFVAALSSIIEPLMIVVMGSIVGVIAASVFGPISNISSNIQ